jgi:dihydroorotate dehydrogenase (fumarate)
LKDLQNLFDSESTGAITTRTSLLDGFEHDPAIHQFAFFDGRDHSSNLRDFTHEKVPVSHGGSLNTLGYSPLPLSTYLDMLGDIVGKSQLPEEVRTTKPIIISVTGSSDAVTKCHRMIRDAQQSLSNPLCMEINLSCPNIPDKPPPAYSKASLIEYLRSLSKEIAPTASTKVAIGIKTPPYTYHDQFQILVDALKESSNPTCPVDFITATNTLGSSLVLGDLAGSPVLNSASGAGIGGMAGTPLHPLALGNVRTIRSMLDQHDNLKSIDVIGVGGVSDGAGYRRMRAVGAAVVGVGTALGREGVVVFSRILQDAI